MNFFSTLQVVFIVLKVLDLVDWSWWLVFAPTYISIGILAFAVFIVLLLSGSESVFQKRDRW